MQRVGIRELRQRASELLRRVERGETLEITDRGRRVALLSPVPDGGSLERLRQAGEVESARGDLDDLPEPLAIEPSSRASPSAVLSRLRRAERCARHGFRSSHRRDVVGRPASDQSAVTPRPSGWRSRS